MPKTEKPKAKPVKAPVKNKGGRKKGTRSPKIFHFKDIRGEKHSLTPMQKLFCDLFLQYEYNGVDAVIGAGYQCYYPRTKTPNRIIASSMARENLQKPSISAYIEKHFEDTGLNDSTIDKHWLFNVVQFSDLNAKNKAIDMYNKKRARYAPDRVEGKIEVVKVGAWKVQPTEKQ